MAHLKLKYVKAYTDRHGQRRHYFRRKGVTLGSLPGAVGSEQFMTAYQQFLGDKPPTGKKAGSLGLLVTKFYGSTEFANLAPNTQILYKKALEPLVKQYGDRPAATMDQEAVRTIIERIGAKRPAMANVTRAVLRVAMKYAVATKWRKDNPVIGLPRYKGGTHHTWTDDELTKFEARWPLGTRERLAYTLLLYTGQRVGDVARMTRADLAAGFIPVVQEKTKAELKLPIAPEIYEAVKAGPANVKWLFADTRGNKTTGATMSVLIRGAVVEAGLPARCKAHGLRKAMLRRLAENGVTDKEMQAVSGHKSLKEIERYTEAANQPKLATAAFEKLKKRT